MHSLRMKMSLIRPLLTRRGFSTSSDKMVAAVLFERLPVVIPKVDPVVYAFQEFSFRWRMQYQRRYPDEFLDRSDARGKGDYQIDYVPAPRITEADKKNDRRSLQRALDKRLYLLLYGNAHGAPSGNPVWHFPEKVYESEETMRKCAESALKSVIGDLSDTYFVGNAPMAHMVVQPKEEQSGSTSFKLLHKAKDFVSDKIGDVVKPEASVTDVDFKRVTMDSAEYLAKVCVQNPYSTPIPICEVNYSFKSANREIASGTIPDPGSLKAKDRTMVDVPVKVPYSILMSLARDIGADWDIDYQLDLGLIIDLPVIGNFTIPLSQKGQLKLPKPF